MKFKLNIKSNCVIYYAYWVNIFNTKILKNVLSKI
jgi:hypothetical protein